MENPRILLEYGIRPGRGNIVVELSENDSHCTLPTVDKVCQSDESVLRSSCTASNPRFGSSLLVSKRSSLSSESSTCASSDFGSEAGDSESAGASLVASALDVAAPMVLSMQPPSPRASCALPVSSTLSLKEQLVHDAFVETNAARVTYLMGRRQRLEATGYGVRELCRRSAVIDVTE